MAFKYILFAAFVAVARAGILAPAPIATTYHATPAIAKVAAPVAIAKAVVDTDYDPNPQYSYSYDIQDALTGDNKNHIESRNGDVVQGQYSLVDPDGTRRIVEYTADPVNGFNAIVHREPLAVKTVAAAPVVAKVATPVAYAAPVAKIATPIAAPISYAAPVAKFAAPIPAPIGYAAPVARFAAPIPAPIGYAAPVARFAAPIQAPIGYAAAPVAKFIH